MRSRNSNINFFRSASFSRTPTLPFNVKLYCLSNLLDRQDKIGIILERQLIDLDRRLIKTRFLTSESGKHC